MTRPSTPERTTLSDIERFVGDKENLVVVRNDEIRCGDGRPTPEQSNGAIRAFGEDFGIMFAIKAALLEKGEKNVDDERLIEAYLHSVTDVRGENPKLFAHTDSHAQKDGGIGCGHAREASNPENKDEYIAPNNSANSLFKAILKRPELDLQVLEGDHQEEAVLIVNSDKNEEGKRFSINSKDREGKHSFFVSDMNAIKDHFDLVTPRIIEELGLELSADEAMKTYEIQQNESAKRLAFSKGLEAYNVYINSSGEATVKQV